MAAKGKLERLNVSVVVVNYNAGPLLKRCIASSYTQVDEIVIVDNASSDTSVDECERLFSDCSHIKFVRNDHNMGYAAACNIGYTHTTGDTVLFLNPDCELDGGAVAEMRQALLADAMVGMVGGLLLNPDGTEQAGARRAIPTPWRSFVRVSGLHRLAERWPKLFYDFHLHKQPLPESPVDVEAISGACMLVRREAVDDVGMWDERYFLHCEDLDWCMRFRGKGWQILFVPTARVTHVLSFCSKGKPFFVEWHKHKGMLRFYRKFFRHQYPLGLMWLVYFGVGMRLLLVFVWKFLVERKAGRLNAKQKQAVGADGD